MLGSLLVIIAIAGFALYQYSKGGIVKAFILSIAVISASIAAFGYYELLAGYMTGYSFLGAKAFPIAFFALFLFVFLIIREIANYLLKPDISLGDPIDKFIGTGIGALAGYIFAGVILITIGLIPYKTNWLYARFDDKVENPPIASGALLNPDAFVCKLFGLVSGGSLGGENSFALLHADYPDQIFLNRLLVSEDISPLAGDGAVSIAKNGVRLAPENLMEVPKNQEQAPPQPVEVPSGTVLTLVKLRVNTRSLAPVEADKQNLGLSQLRLILKPKDSQDKYSGSGRAVYPIGYLNSDRQLVLKPLNTSFADELKSEGTDFAFYVPENEIPVLLEFRHNIVERIGTVGPAEELIVPERAPIAAPNEPAPQPTPFEPIEPNQ